MDVAPMRSGTDSAARGQGVRNLMQAVLLDAILCLHAGAGPAKDRERLALDARQWMASTARTWPFSFESVCDALGINASDLRTLLLGSRAPLGKRSPTEDIVQRLSTVRMQGNRRTRVLAKRDYPSRRKNRDL